MNTLQDKLKKLGACGAARKWVGDRSLTRAWNECENPDWLLWLAGRTVDRKLVVLAACDCARTALKYVPKGEDRPRLAIEAAEAWTRGEAADAETIRAASAAAHAASHATTTYITYAAYTAAARAAYAAYAADAAHYAANAAYYAADAAHYAADADAAHYAAARRKSDRALCKLVRKRIPLRVVQVGMRGVK